MKVIELLQMFDEYDANIIIWHVEDMEEDKPTFQGFMSDVPYWLTQCVIKGKLATRKYTNTHNVTFGAICIEVEGEIL